jgi:hypothetical protein
VPKYHIYQETTEWAEQCPNNIYVFNDRVSGRTATCVAYVPHGSEKVIKLKTPLKLDLKGRTFAPLD